MRDLILVRGAPASGKSTWIAENHLEPYTISPDSVRLMYSSPIPDPATGELHMNMRNEQLVWDFIEDIMTLRMRTGQFIVLDAQDGRYDRWIKLAKKFYYNVWFKQIDATKDECLARNAARDPLHRLPDYVMLQAFMWLENNPMPSSVWPVTDAVVAGTMEPTVVDKYRRIHFCGDIHGSYVPLKRFYDDTDGFNEKELFVFVGDYADRGTAPKETLELLMAQRDKPNVIFLEGNHRSERIWVDACKDEIRSKEFLYHTMPQLEGIDKRALKEWCHKWQQLAYLQYHGKRYFVTHAGIGYMPEHIRWVPAHTYIRGGDYEEDVEREWCEQCYGPDLIQVHGHRNFYGYPMEEADESINLNSPVEFGADWRVLTVSKDMIEYHYYPNPDHQPINTALAEFMLEPNKVIGEPDGTK